MHLKITRQVLAEMATLASKGALDTSRLSYTEVQQVLTLHSLKMYLATFNIELEIELDIKELDVINKKTSEED